MSNDVDSSQASVLDEKLALVSVTISMFSGYRRARREDIAELGGKLPDSQAVTEGSIKVFPNERLNPFATIRRGVFRRLGNRGVKALGSGNVYAVPRDALAEVEDILEQARSAYAAEVDKLDANFDPWFEEYVRDNLDAETILRKLAIPKSAALARFGFSSTVFKIVPIERADQPGDQPDDVQSIVDGLARQLFEEIAAEAEALLEKSDAFAKLARAGQKSLRPIREAVKKMRGLQFLDPVIGGAVVLVEDTLAALPQAGYIEDTAAERPYSMLKRMLVIMSDPQQFLDAAARIHNGMSVTEILLPPAPAPQPQAQPPSEPAAPVTQAELPAGFPSEQDGSGPDPDVDLSILDNVLPTPPVPAMPAVSPELMMF